MGVRGGRKSTRCGRWDVPRCAINDQPTSRARDIFPILTGAVDRSPASAAITEDANLALSTSIVEYPERARKCFNRGRRVTPRIW